MSVEAVLSALLAAAILGATPLMLAAVGEAIGERAGLLNLGLEGTMLLGGFGGFWLALRSDAPWLGLLGGALVGSAVGVAFGALAVLARADQVILGLGLTLAGGGLTDFLFRQAYGSDQPLLAASMSRPFAAWSDAVPVIGPALLGQKWFVYVAWGMVIAAHWLLHRSTLGLRLRAVGDAPFAVDASGISVGRTRLAAAVLANMLAGLGGATLVIVELGFFRPHVTLGAGFIAIALAMLGRLTPWRVALVALLFGLLRGLDAGLQLMNIPLRAEFLQMIPYAGVVAALIVLGRHIGLPAALGRPYVRSTSRGDT